MTKQHKTLAWGLEDKETGELFTEAFSIRQDAENYAGSWTCLVRVEIKKVKKK